MLVQCYDIGLGKVKLYVDAIDIYLHTGSYITHGIAVYLGTRSSKYRIISLCYIDVSSLANVCMGPGWQGCMEEVSKTNAKSLILHSVNITNPITKRCV